MLFEALEPRILLSADPLGVAELLAPASPLVFDAAINATADSYTLRFNADNGNLELLNGADLVAGQALAATSAVVINGEDGQDDNLTIDFAFGGVFSLEGGILYNGGTGGIDKLSVAGGEFISAMHTATDTGPGLSGTMVYEDGAHAPLVIEYTDLEPVDMTGSTIANLVFNLTSGNHRAILEDDGTAGNGISQLRSSNGSFETTTFSTSATSLTIHILGGLTVNSLPDFSGALIVDGPATEGVLFTGSMTFSSLSVKVLGTIGSTPGTNLNVIGEAAFASQLDIDFAEQDVINFGTLNLNTSTFNSDVRISEDSDMVLAGDSHLAGSLSLTSAGTITDTGTLRADFLALFRGTSIVLTDRPGEVLEVRDALTLIGTSGGGIVMIASDGRATASNLVHFSSTGAVNISLDSDLGVGSGLAASVILSSAGSIQDDGFNTSVIRASTVTLLAGGGIGAAGNEIDTDVEKLNASAGGDIYVVEASDIMLGAVVTPRTVSIRSVAGSILDDGNDASLIVASVATLSASGGIGAAGNEIETAIGTLNAVAGSIAGDQAAADIYVLEADDIILADVRADPDGPGTVSVRSVSGSILDDGNDGTRIVASAATLLAGGSIGTAGNAIDTDAAVLSAQAGLASGDQGVQVVVREANDIVLATLSTDGNANPDAISITSINGSILDDGNDATRISAWTVALDARAQIGAGGAGNEIDTSVAGGTLNLATRTPGSLVQAANGIDGSLAAGAVNITAGTENVRVRTNGGTVENMSGVLNISSGGTTAAVLGFTAALGDLRLGAIGNGFQPVTLTASAGSILDDGNGATTAAASMLRLNAALDINVDTDAGFLGAQAGLASGDQFVQVVVREANDVALLAVSTDGGANPDTISITSTGGSILDDGFDDTWIAASVVTLSAAQNIGAAGNEIDTAVERVSAAAGGFVHLTEADTIILGAITAGGDVRLAARAGSILDDGDDTTRITASVATLSAGGGIGTAGSEIGTAVAVLHATAGTLAADQSAADVYIVEADAVTLGTITADAEGPGAVSIRTLTASIFDDGDQLTRVTGSTVTLDARVRIGAIGAGSEIDTSVAGGTLNLISRTPGNQVQVANGLDGSLAVGALNISAGSGNVRVQTNGGVLENMAGSLNASFGGAAPELSYAAALGNLRVGAVTGGLVTLAASAGSILDDGSDATRVTAYAATLSAAGSVGVAGNEIDVAAGRLNAAAGTGVYVMGDAIVLGAITSGQEMVLTAGAGSITGAAGASISVGGDAKFAAGSIRLTENSGDTLDVAGHASFDAASISIGAAGAARFGSLSFNAIGSASISEDGDMVLAGASAAHSVSLSSEGSITDAAGASIVATADASFTAGSIGLADGVGNVVRIGAAASFTANAGAITIGAAGVVDLGLLTFSSAGAVSISQDTNVLLLGTSVASGDLSLASGGSISDVNSGSASIRGGNVTLTAAFDIGSKTAPIDTDIVGLAATSGALGDGSVFINEVDTIGGNGLTLDLVNAFGDGTGAAGDVSISTAGALLDSNAGINVRAGNVTLVALGNIGGGLGAIETDVTTLAATAGGSVTIVELDSGSADGLALNLVRSLSNAQSVSITSTGAITDNNGAASNIQGTFLFARLTAGTNLGIALDEIETDVFMLDARSGTAGAGGVFISELDTNGDGLFVNLINADDGAGVITLRNLAGDIWDGNGVSTNLLGTEATLSAGRDIGSNGFAIDALETEVYVITATSGAAAATGNIHLFNPFASLWLGTIAANEGLGAINIRAGLGIFDGNGEAANLQGGAVTLLATGGSIGGAADALETEITALAATSSEAVHINELATGGSLALALIDANNGTGAINIKTLGATGDITDGNASQVNLRGGTVTLSAGRHIGFDGAAVNALETQVGTLSVTAGTGPTTDSDGEIHVDELDGELTLASVSAAGTLRLTSEGSITDLPGASLTVTGNAKLTAQSISLGSGGTVNFGSVTFTSTGSVSIAEDSDTTLAGSSSAGSLFLNAGGEITDDIDSQLTVTGTASFTGASITLGDSATDAINLGSLTFNSPGSVSIAEDSDTALAGDSTAAGVTLEASGAVRTEGGFVNTAELSVKAGAGVVLDGNHAIKQLVADGDVELGFGSVIDGLVDLGAHTLLHPAGALTGNAILRMHVVDAAAGEFTRFQLNSGFSLAGTLEVVVDEGALEQWTRLRFTDFFGSSPYAQFEAVVAPAGVSVVPGLDEWGNVAHLDLLWEPPSVATVHYDAATHALTFTAGSGSRDDVSVWFDHHLLHITVANGNTLALTGDIDPGRFFLSEDATDLIIGAAGAIEAYTFVLDDADDAQDDSLQLPVDDRWEMSLRSITVEGGGGVDSVSLHTVTMRESLSIAAEAITVDGAVTTGGSQLYDGDVALGGDGIFSAGSDSSRVENSIVFNRALAAGDHDLSVTAGEIDFNGGAASVSGAGQLALRQSWFAFGDIVVGGESNGWIGQLDLTLTDLDALADGFSAITIERERPEESWQSTREFEIAVLGGAFKDSLILRAFTYHGEEIFGGSAIEIQDADGTFDMTYGGEVNSLTLATDGALHTEARLKAGTLSITAADIRGGLLTGNNVLSTDVDELNISILQSLPGQQSDGEIIVREASGLLQLGIDAAGGMVDVIALGEILDGDAEVDIVAGEARLEARKVGTAASALDTAVDRLIVRQGFDDEGVFVDEADGLAWLEISAGREVRVTTAAPGDVVLGLVRTDSYFDTVVTLDVAGALVDGNDRDIPEGHFSFNNIEAESAVLSAGTAVGSSADAIDVQVEVLTAYTTDAESTGGGVFIAHTGNELDLLEIVAAGIDADVSVTADGAWIYLGTVTALGDDVSITGAAIVDAQYISPFEVINVSAGSLTLSAAFYVGDINNPIETDAGALTVASGTAGDGGIYINELDTGLDGLALNLIDAYGDGVGQVGDVVISSGLHFELSLDMVTLTSLEELLDLGILPAGSIRDGNGAALNIRAGAVSLTAGTHIGASGDALETDVTSIEARAGIADPWFGRLQHDGGVYIDELDTASADGLAIGEIRAGERFVYIVETVPFFPYRVVVGEEDRIGDVHLTSAGSIWSDGLASSVIRAETLTLQAALDIGGAGASVGTDVARLGAVAGGSLFINEQDTAGADGLVLDLVSAAGSIVLASAGDITDGNGTALNLQASVVTLSAGRHIGFDGATVDALETEIGVLAATSGTAAAAGDIYVEEAASGGSLALNAVVAAGGAGAIGITAAGATADITGLVRGAEVTLAAGRDISVSAQAARLTAHSGIGGATGNITVNTSGSLALGLIDADEGAGRISISTNQGAITDGNGAALNIRGAEVTLKATRHIGSNGVTANALESEIDVLYAYLISSDFAGSIRISETASGGALTLGEVKSSIGGTFGFIDIATSGADGDILAGQPFETTRHLSGAGVTLSAGRHIGSAARPLDVLASAPEGQGGLAAASGTTAAEGDIHIRGASLRLNLVSADGGAGAIDLRSLSGGITDNNGAEMNLIGAAATLSAAQSIGSVGSSGIRDALETKLASLTADALGGDVDIDQVGGSLLLNRIGAAGAPGSESEIRITTRGVDADILDGNGAAANLAARHVVLTAGRHIGFDGITIDALDVQNSAVTASSHGDIYLNQLAAATGLTVLELDLIDANGGAGSIGITSAGSIMGSVSGLNLRGGAVTLSAAGHIGDAFGDHAFLGVQVGSLAADARGGNVRIEQVSGSLVLNRISASGDIVLTADPVGGGADILDGNGSAVNLAGRNVTLTAARHIGFGGATIDALETEAATLSATSGDWDFTGDIYIQEAASGGSLALGLIEARRGVGAISITTNGASSDITDANGSALNLLGGSVTLSAGRHIGFNGTAIDALETQVGTLRATSGTAATAALSGFGLRTMSFASLGDPDSEGEIHVDQVAGELTLASVSAAGDVEFSAASLITITGDVDVGANDVLFSAPSVVVAPTGVLHVDLGGTGEGDFTQIMFSDAVMLGGTLEVELTGGFVPAAGDEFGFLAAGTQSGTFAETVAPEGLVIDEATGTATPEINHAPVFVEIGPRTVEEGRELRFTVQAADTDGDALTYAAGAMPAGATFNALTREFVWTPVDEASGSVTFTVTDSRGESDVMTVALKATNAAPRVEAGADQVVGLQDIDEDRDDDHREHRKDKDKPEAEVSIAAAFGDLGVSDTHAATINWGDGTFSSGKVTEPGGGADGLVKGKHTYTKAGVYTVTVTVTDNDGGVKTDTLKVTVKKPVETKNFDSRADDYKLTEDGVLQVNAAKGVLANDRSPAAATLAARVVEGPEHGTLKFNADGSFTYVPDRNYNGKDSFWYEFTDGNNVSQAVEVKLNVKDDGKRPSHGGTHRNDCWPGHWHSDYRPFGKGWR